MNAPTTPIHNGSPGGSTIITVVLQEILNVLAFDMNVAEATATPRVHHQWQPDNVITERGISDDTLRILRDERAQEVGGVMHCFTESADVARAALDLGFHISFSGILTFKSAKALREVATIVPDERLLVETDAPYLAPVPHRGKSNEPAWVLHVAQCLAQLRNQDIEHIKKVTSNNFFKLFNVL